jgi:diacylglycerol kinase family enzyme
MLLGVIVNANALGVRRQPGLVERLRVQVGGDGEVVETRSPDDLPALMRAFAAQDIQLLCACGGDGTNRSAASEMVRTFAGRPLPMFAILRGGTLNTVAKNLRIEGRPEQILQPLVDRLRAGAVVNTIGQDLLQVNDMHGFLFAAAMGARFLDAYYGAPGQSAAWAAAVAARAAGSCLVSGPFARRLFSPVAMTLSLDGAPTHEVERCRLLVASTVPDVGLGVRLNWQAGRQPGRFHLIASALSTPQLALQLHRTFAGRPLAGRPHLDTLARTAVVTFTADEPFTLDGDLFRARRVELSVGPRLWIAREPIGGHT